MNCRMRWGLGLVVAAAVTGAAQQGIDGGLGVDAYLMLEFNGEAEVAQLRSALQPTTVRDLLEVHGRPMVLPGAEPATERFIGVDAARLRRADGLVMARYDVPAGDTPLRATTLRFWTGVAMLGLCLPGAALLLWGGWASSRRLQRRHRSASAGKGGLDSQSQTSSRDATGS